MKRNLDLVRRLLMVIESAGRQGRIDTYGLNVTDPEVQYHLRLMVDAHLLQCVGVAEDGAIAVRLTWQGHEMLELCRNEAMWERAKSFVQRRTQGLSAAVLQDILSKWALSCAADAENIRYIEHRGPSTATRPLPRPRVSVPPSPSNGNGSEKQEKPSNGRSSYDPLPPRAPVYQQASPSYATPANASPTRESYRETYHEPEINDADWRLRADPWYGKYLDGMPIYLL